MANKNPVWDGVIRPGRINYRVSRTDDAFTLVELLVVISIIGLLMGILLPSLTRARQLSKKVVCLSNMRQMGIALQSYVIDNGARPERILAEPSGAAHKRDAAVQVSVRQGKDLHRLDQAARRPAD
jgi:prepilin-type N-terminal cleavage/methylation domain-containing protein